MIKMNTTAVSRRLAFLLFCLVLLSGSSLFAADEAAKVSAAAGTASKEGGETGEVKPAILDQVSARLIEERKAGTAAAQASQVAQDLAKINAEQKALAQTSAERSKLVDGFSDPELLLKSKMALVDKKKDLLERKAAFLAQKIRTQKDSHSKLQFFITNVFSDDASVLMITEQIKDMERRRATRLSEKERLTRELGTVSSRIQIEEQYLSAKKVLLAASRDDERARIQETVTLAEERLKVFQDLKVFIGEQLDFVAFRTTALEEFEKLIKLRRRELLKARLMTQAPIPYGRDEVAISLLSLLLLAAGYGLRKRFEAWVRAHPSFLNQEGILFWTKMLWRLGLLSLMGCAILDLSEYRAASIALGLVYLNIALGLFVFMVVKSLVEALFMRVLQGSAKATPAEVKQTSSVFLLVRTVLMWLIFGFIFYQILRYWAVEQETVRWLVGIVNEPFFQSEKIKVSVWAIVRSLLVFWLFYVGSRFLNGILRARVYPKSSLDKNSQHAIKSVIQFSFIVIGAMAGIQLLGVDLSVFAVFSGALGVGIGFGLQDIVKNVFSGFVIFFERPIRMGDVVEVGGVPGIVKSIRTRSTIVNTFDNIAIVVPNSEFLTNRVVNWSHSDRTVRVESRVGVGYDSDVALVKETLLEIAEAITGILPQPESVVVFEEFADSALIFRLLYWVDVADRMDVKSKINFAIHSRFKDKGISIPFPQRDVHIKSSDFERSQGENK